MKRPPRDYDELWRQLKAVLRLGDILHGRVHSRNEWWLNIDVGLPLLANLDAADAPVEFALAQGDPVDVLVKGFDDRRRQVRVSARLDGWSGAKREVKIPKALHGPVVWPPPVAAGISAEGWQLQRERF